MKAVAFFEHQRSGCYWYRIKQKMDALARAGIPTIEIDLKKDIDLDNVQSIQLYGAYPFSTERALRIFKDQGIKIIYDTDDALNLVDKENPFYHAVKRDLNSVSEILTMADEVTVSTPKMAEYIQNISPNSQVTVLPNTYTKEEWVYPKVEREGIRIGLAGGAPHVMDLLMVIPAIRQLQDAYNVKFMIMGFGQSDYTTWFKQYRYICGDEALPTLIELDRALSTIIFEWVPFVDFNIYPQVLANLGLDIGICPLKNTVFNQHRSAIKPMEYLLSGAIPLASNTINYQHEPTSTLVNDTEWATELEQVILNKESYKEKAAQQLLWLQENREISSQLELLKSIYVVE